jgi:hypothetical protein
MQMFFFNELINDYCMRRKGNVLQYKANQTPLSNNMIYARKVRGEWTNNRRTYATQNQRIANPNTESLLRIGGTRIVVSGDPTSTNSYCIYDPASFPSNQPSPIINIPEYQYETPPESIVDPPPQQDPITAPEFDPPDVPAEEPINYVAPSGGIFICSQTVIPTCNTSVEGQTVITQSYNQMCFTADHSDVPGLCYLCWNEGTQTWYDHTTDVST